MPAIAPEARLDTRADAGGFFSASAAVMQHNAPLMVRPTLLATALALLTGCPGSLANPERFLGGSDGGCDVETDLFKMQCGVSGCHDPVTQSQNLDLVSAGVKDRLRANLATCASAAGQPLAAFMIAKVKPQPSCGAQMPLAAPALETSELKCLEAYIAALDGGI